MKSNSQMVELRLGASDVHLFVPIAFFLSPRRVSSWSGPLETVHVEPWSKTSPQNKQSSTMHTSMYTTHYTGLYAQVG